MVNGSARPATEPKPDPKRKRSEHWAFLILAFAIWPILAVGVVGAYGFIVWMWQATFGPPGPPVG